jgi:hypothetical protein
LIQALDLVEPGSNLTPEMLPLFRRKLKARELDQVLIERVRQPEDDLLHQRPADTTVPGLLRVSCRVLIRGRTS